MRAGDHAVEGEGEDFGGATGGWRDGEVTGGVVEELGFEHGDVGYGFAVERPTRGIVYAGVGSDLGEVSAPVGIGGGDDPDVCVVVKVGIGSRAVACEG